MGENMKYRKKPIIVEAFQWTGGPDQTEDPSWIVEAIKNHKVFIEDHSIHPCVMKIWTDEGQMKAIPSDYIIKGIEGEIYPCKASVFEKTYEKVEATP